MAYEDGTYTAPKANGTRRTRFPFVATDTQDKYARIHERDFVVRSPIYIPVSSDRASVTNLLTYSEAFDNAAWTKADSTVTANSVANPADGATTADSLKEAATNAEHTIAQAGTITATAATLSVCVSALSRDWVRLKITDSAAAVKTAFFNLSTGVVGTVSSGATSDMVMIVPGWYRCALTFTSPASGAATCLIQPSTDGTTVSYAGDTAKGLYLFGAQLEQSASANQYASTTSTTRTISAPPTDDTQNGALDPYADPFAYLLGELIPERLSPSAQYFQFRRPYARIPADQVTYPGSRYFPLPSVQNDFGLETSIPVLKFPVIAEVGNGYVSIASGAIYTDYQQSLYAAIKTCGTKAPGYATAGTFTLTFGANTTAALNWNDTGATIATAINGLASVSAAGLTCTTSNVLNTTTGGDLIITWTVGSTLTPVTMSATSLTVTTSKNPTTQISSLTQQDILLPDHITITSHGLSTSLALATVQSSADRIVVLPTSYWGSIDANTIWTPSFGTVDPLSYVATFKQSYVPGKIYLLRTRMTEKFYIPGVSVGITTAADITTVLGLQNPADFVLALATLTGWQTYDTDGPALWEGGPHYRIAFTDINLDDV